MKQRVQDDTTNRYPSMVKEGPTWYLFICKRKKPSSSARPSVKQLSRCLIAMTCVLQMRISKNGDWSSLGQCIPPTQTNLARESWYFLQACLTSTPATCRACLPYSRSLLRVIHNEGKQPRHASCAYQGLKTSRRADRARA